MYTKFHLNLSGANLMGYHWKVCNPSHVVVLVHGIGEYAGKYNLVANKFMENQIAMVGMDLRGHGESSGKRGHTSPRSMIFSDIDALIQYTKDLYPNIPIILYGHSMGGNIVLHYKKAGLFANIPIGYLVTSPWIVLVRKIPIYLYFIVKFLAKIKPDFQINSGIRIELLGNEKVLSQQPNRKLNHSKISVKTALDGFEIGKALFDNTLEKKINSGNDIPLLLMHGTADKICSIEGSRKIAENEKKTCQYIEWQDLFHEIHHGNATENGQKVIEKMIKWVKEQ